MFELKYYFYRYSLRVIESRNYFEILCPYLLHSLCFDFMLKIVLVFLIQYVHIVFQVWNFYYFILQLVNVYFMSCCYFLLCFYFVYQDINITIHTWVLYLPIQKWTSKSNFSLPSCL